MDQNLGTRLINYLPLHLHREILLRLPTKSLARFKSVCKDWFAMISDPEFERVNFQDQMSKVMIVCRIEVSTPRIIDFIESTPRYYSYKLEGDGVRASKSGVLFDSFTDEDGIYAARSCNSLILVSYCRRVNRNRLYVYDAMNHRRRLLPPTPSLLSLDSCESLVYDASTQKYKVVLLTYKLLSPLTQCCVYTFDRDGWCGEDSWRLIPLPDVQRRTYEQGTEGLEVAHSYVVCRGMLHWMIFDRQREPFIQPLDIAKERFLGRIEFPHILDCKGVGQLWNYSLLELKGSLCLMKSLMNTSVTDDLIIWVLKDSSNWDVQYMLSVSSIARDPTNWLFDDYILARPQLVLESCNGKMTHILLYCGNSLYWSDLDGKEMRRILIEFDSNDQGMSYRCYPIQF